MSSSNILPGDQSRALWLSTAAFTLCFALWTIFSVIGVQIKKDLGLSDMQFGLLVGAPILTGSLIRLILGIWSDRYGGRVVYALVMGTAAAATALLSLATDYTGFLLAALGVGISGGSFAVGVAYVSRWYGKEKQGLALGIFGAGNVGSALTKFLAPVVMVLWGWQAVSLIWAGVLALMALVFWFGTKDDPHHVERKSTGAPVQKITAMLQPLKKIQVWRFSFYYFFTFGGFVAIALWLPRYYMGVYGLDIITAGLLGAGYSVPGSIFRILGGQMSDTLGARKVMYLTFLGSLACLGILSIPGLLEFPFFMAVTFLLGFFMSLGKAGVYKHIPVYYPHHVGPVGGIVGLIGGLGGFILPIVFGGLLDWTGLWTSSFLLLTAIAGLGFLWMHLSILGARFRQEKGNTTPGELESKGPHGAD